MGSKHVGIAAVVVALGAACTAASTLPTTKTAQEISRTTTTVQMQAVETQATSTTIGDAQAIPTQNDAVNTTTSTIAEASETTTTLGQSAASTTTTSEPPEDIEDLLDGLDDLLSDLDDLLAGLDQDGVDLDEAMNQNEGDVQE